jgi:sec-independent protein translocase protein TatC
MSTEAEKPDEFRMSLADHLTELRSRLLRVTLSVLVLGSVSLIYARELYGFLMRPVLVALPPDASALVYTSAIEEINVLMKVGMYAGVFLSTPVLLWQIWGFVAPGLYDQERKLAGPFVFFGTVAFLCGAAFCYFALLPQMFGFLLREETSVALEARLEAAQLREQDIVRRIALGDLEKAGVEARAATGDIEAPGDGQAKEGQFGIRLIPRRSVEVKSRLDALGRVADATLLGLGPSARPVLATVLDKRAAAVKAYGDTNLDEASKLTDEAAALLAGVQPERAQDFADLWKLERDLSAGKADYEARNWTKPMLSMSEQLTLVLVLELAFGLIFELPLVMALLGLVGLVSSAFLFKYQRHAFVVCLIAAAVITPTGDAVNLALMAGPMLACYEIGVLLVWIFEKKRKAQTPAT